MLEHLTGAMFFVSKTSIIWAPLIIGTTVWMPRYRWPAAVCVATAMLALFVGISIHDSIQPDCRSLNGSAVVLCAERQIGRAMLQVTIAGAGLIASAIFLTGLLFSRNRETRKVAH